MSNFTRILKTQVKFLKQFHVKNVFFVKFDVYFSRSHKKFSLVLLQVTNHIYKLEKLKKNAILFKLFWYKIFAH